MALPYWISSMLAATPALVWAFLVVGIPWALAVLPRKDWRDRVMVVALALAFGATLLTAWMFILGMIGAASGDSVMRLDTILAGTVVMAAAGGALAWRKRLEKFTETKRESLAVDEGLLIVLIVSASIIQWFSVAYWPFMTYDALWVFGYQGRLYTLLGYIPNTIGYYPQFLSLQYTYAQFAVGGINDHAARAVLPFLNVGSILAAYVLGSRLFTRRVGIYAAALWALYPHFGEWSRFGDLEIALTFLFTLSAAFFLMAWNDPAAEYRRRYALIAGFIFGAAMWTKPTAGAFVWGVILLLLIDLMRVRFHWRAWRPRLEVAVITGLACLPLGAVWYVRNALMGHEIIEFPTAFWLSQAARSGAEFGWPLLALLVLLACVYFGRLQPRPDLRRVLIGLLLVLAGLLPSIINPHRMMMVEWLLLAAGAGLLFITLLPYARRFESAHALALKIGWVLALALPYFVTWLYSYSYHYRLSFAIVPLLSLPIAVILAYWIKPASMSKMQRLVFLAVISVIGLPGVVSALHDVNAGWDWLWTDKMPDDMARYKSGNGALMSVVEGLQIYLDENDTPLVVAAPGVKRLPFFFPSEDIRVDDSPTRLDQLEGVTYFIDSSPEGTGAYANIAMTQNQVISALALAGSTVENVTRLAWGKNDGIFRYDVYELHLERRFIEPQVIHDPEEAVVFGGFARFRGHGIGADTLWPGRPVYMQLYWEVLAPPPEDYMIYIHLRDANDEWWASWDGPVTHTTSGFYYSTLVWEPGEYISDERLLKLTDEKPPPGDGYRIVIGLYNLQTGARVPVTIGGQPAGDGYKIDEDIKVLSEEPD